MRFFFFNKIIDLYGFATVYYDHWVSKCSILATITTIHGIQVCRFLNKIENNKLDSGYLVFGQFWLFCNKFFNSIYFFFIISTLIFDKADSLSAVYPNSKSFRVDVSCCVLYYLHVVSCLFI